MAVMLTPLPKTIHGARVVRDLGTRSYGSQRKRRRFCEIECPGCGEVREITVSDVKSGRVRCRACSNSKHGFCQRPVYRVWQDLNKRCGNPNSPNYKYYGGRGISVCKAWRDAETFIRWAMANGYADTLTLDRVDNDGNYTPSNCRWTTRTVQSRNSRRLRSSNTSGYRGVSFDASRQRWQAKIKVDYKTLYLGRFDSPKEAAHAYDAYVIAHGLEHTLNFEVVT